MSPKTTTPERDAFIVRLWKAEQTSNQIAALLGISRNTVIGAIDRARKRGELPLYREDSRVPVERQLAHEAKVAAARKAEAERLATQSEDAKMQAANRRKGHVRKAEATPFVAPPVPEPVSTEGEDTSSPAKPKELHGVGHYTVSFFDPDPPDLDGVSLAHIKNNQCRSILPGKSHQGLAVFCGKPTKSLISSWCAKHHALYYSRVPPKRDGFTILKRKQEA